MNHITVESQGIVAALSRLSAQLADLRPVLTQIGGVMQQAVSQNFATEGARLGEKWQQSQRARKWGGKTLQKTGRLAASVVAEVATDSVTVGTNVEYAAINHFGGTVQQAAQSRMQDFHVNSKTGKSRFATRKKANFTQWTSRGAYNIRLPPRPFMALNAIDEDKILKTIMAALT